MARPDPPQPVAEEGLWIAYDIKGKAFAGCLAPDGFAGDDKGRQQAGGGGRTRRADNEILPGRPVTIDDGSPFTRKKHLHRARDPLYADGVHASLRRFQTGTAVRTLPTKTRRVSRNIAGKVSPKNEIVEKKATPDIAM